MPVARVDPRLLAPVDGRVPAETVLADFAGEPAALRFEGPPGEAGRGQGPSASWSGVASGRAFLHGAVALTVGVGAPAAVRDAFDLYTDDAATADGWLARFEQSPRAAVAAALLTRHASDDVWAGLVAESTTYSMLQTGPEFEAWRRDRCPPSAPTDLDRPRVRVERGEVYEVVLTRPGRHNALDVAMRDQLHAALDEARGMRGPVVVRGEGPSFCSGGDLAEFGTAPGPVDAHLVRLSRSLALTFAELGPRLVVALHGACLGAGVELAAFAARVVAAHDARIGLPEIGFGLVPGAGGTVSIPRRAGRHRLLELLLGPDTIEAGTALAWGVVDELVPRARLEERAREVAAALR